MHELHIASCVIRAMPPRLDDIARTIAANTRCEVVATHPGGKLVVLVEGNSTGELLDQVDAIRAFAGVISIELVYQHAEPIEVMKEPMPCQ